MIDNKQLVCEHGGLNTIIARKGKYIPGNLYNIMKEKLIKNWQSQSVLGFNLSEDIPNVTNRDISESNMIYEIFIRELWHEIPKKLSY